MTRESWHDGTYSHGWGSSAIVGVSWGLMGVHELTAGWATFLVKPKLGADWTGLQRICRRQCTQWRAKSTIGFVSARPWVVMGGHCEPQKAACWFICTRHSAEHMRLCAHARLCLVCIGCVDLHVRARFTATDSLSVMKPRRKNPPCGSLHSNSAHLSHNAHSYAHYNAHPRCNLGHWAQAVSRTSRARYRRSAATSL